MRRFAILPIVSEPHSPFFHLDQLDSVPGSRISNFFLLQNVCGNPNTKYGDCSLRNSTKTGSTHPCYCNRIIFPFYQNLFGAFLASRANNQCFKVFDTKPFGAELWNYCWCVTPAPSQPPTGWHGHTRDLVGRFSGELNSDDAGDRDLQLKIQVCCACRARSVTMVVGHGSPWA